MAPHEGRAVVLVAVIGVLESCVDTRRHHIGGDASDSNIDAASGHTCIDDLVVDDVHLDECRDVLQCLKYIVSSDKMYFSFVKYMCRVTRCTSMFEVHRVE
jgi:hypothetical protein